MSSYSLVVCIAIVGSGHPRPALQERCGELIEEYRGMTNAEQADIRGLSSTMLVAVVAGFLLQEFFSQTPISQTRMFIIRRASTGL